jgi:hypothetical protein
VRRLGPLVLLAVLAAGCFGGGSHKVAVHRVKPGKPQGMVVVTEKDGSLDPKSVTLPKAGVYRFQAVNQGKRAHALAIVGPGGVNVKTAKLKPGQSTTVDVRISKPGSYRYFSPVDGDRKKGMEGVAVLSG